MPKTDAQRRAENKYKADKLDSLLIRYPKGTKAKIHNYPYWQEKAWHATSWTQ